MRRDEMVCDEMVCDEMVCDEMVCDEMVCDEMVCDEALGLGSAGDVIINLSIATLADL